MTLEEIKEKHHELNEESLRINNELFHLAEQRCELQQERLKPLVGKAYRNRKNNHTIFVYSVPFKVYRALGLSFNEYQIPVLKTSVDNGMGGPSVPTVEIDTIFSHVCEAKDPVKFWEKDWEEIPATDFLQEIIDQYVMFMSDVRGTSIKEDNL